MSRELTAAKRYARAMYEVAKDKDSVNVVMDDMKAAADVFGSQQDLVLLMASPNMNTSAKTDLIKQIFAGKVSDIVLNTLVLLVERKRSDLIPTVYEQFIKIANEELGRAHAVVYTPKALTVEEEAAVAAKFSNLTGKTIQVTNIVDPSLLGGMKVRIGDKLYDGSLSSKLERMEKVLQASQAL